MGEGEDLQTTFLAIVDNQLCKGEPRETKKTLKRLVTSGFSREEAKKLIASVIAVEACSVLKEKRPFDEADYIKALHLLPQLPWGEFILFPEMQSTVEKSHPLE